MTKIKDYPQVADVAANDLILGTRAADGATVNFPFNVLSAACRAATVTWLVEDAPALAAPDDLANRLFGADSTGFGSYTLAQLAAIFGGGATGVQSIVAGANITVDSTDPSNPVVSSTGGAGASCTYALNADAAEVGAIAYDGTPAGYAGLLTPHTSQGGAYAITAAGSDISRALAPSGLTTSAAQEINIDNKRAAIQVEFTSDSFPYVIGGTTEAAFAELLLVSTDTLEIRGRLRAQLWADGSITYAYNGTEITTLTSGGARVVTLEIENQQLQNVRFDGQLRNISDGIYRPAVYAVVAAGEQPGAPAAYAGLSLGVRLVSNAAEFVGPVTLGFPDPCGNYAGYQQPTTSLVANSSGVSGDTATDALNSLASSVGNISYQLANPASSLPAFALKSNLFGTWDMRDPGIEFSPGVYTATAGPNGSNKPQTDARVEFGAATIGKKSLGLKLTATTNGYECDFHLFENTGPNPVVNKPILMIRRSKYEYTVISTGDPVGSSYSALGPFSLAFANNEEWLYEVDFDTNQGWVIDPTGTRVGPLALGLAGPVRWGAVNGYAGYWTATLQPYGNSLTPTAGFENPWANDFTTALPPTAIPGQSLTVSHAGRYVAGGVDFAGAVNDVFIVKADGVAVAFVGEYATAWQPATLLNDWANIAGAQAAQFRKVGDTVQIRLAIENGTASGLFTLPVGFRPPATIRAGAQVEDNTAAPDFGQIIVDASGNVSLAHPGSLSNHKAWAVFEFSVSA